MSVLMATSVLTMESVKIHQEVTDVTVMLALNKKGVPV